MGENNIDICDPEEVEEALSLCDLPLDTDVDTNEKGFERISDHTRRSSSEPSEFFEFFSDFSAEMCPAEDIIFCGKLVPFKEQPISIQPPKSSIPKDDKKQLGFRKRSESLSDLNSSSISLSDSAKNNRLLRSSRSLDCKKLQRLSSSKTSSDPDMERNSSTRSIGKSDMSSRKSVKPRWYIFIFGMVKFPPEMELKDIKNRQFRKNPSAMFPPLDAGKKLPPVTRSSGRGSWSLLKALSCRDHTSVAVTTSFCMPHA